MCCVLAVAAALTACGRTATLAPLTPSTTTAATPTTGAGAGATGRLVPTYEVATSTLGRTGEQRARAAKLLETLADGGNEVLALPRDIPLNGAECGTANAFYDPAEQSITLCYEIIALVDELARTQAGTDTAMADRRFTGFLSMIFFHELGHAAIDVYQLPSTGREEDNADQLAALILISDPDGGGAQTVADSARSFFDLARGTTPGMADFADVHSLSEQRGYNLLCWVHGSDPTAYAQLVEPTGALPASRAVACRREYSQLYNAWITLLRPHLKDRASDGMEPG